MNALNKQAGQNLEHKHGADTNNRLYTETGTNGYKGEHTHTYDKISTTSPSSSSAKSLKGDLAWMEATSIGEWTHSGIFSGSTYKSQKDTYGSSDYYAIKASIDATHSHSISSSGSHQHFVTVTPDGGNENRPDNYTINVWKRTA